MTKLSQVHHRARDLGRDSFMLAYLLDSHKEEQERGISMYLLLIPFSFLFLCIIYLHVLVVGF